MTPLKASQSLGEPPLLLKRKSQKVVRIGLVQLEFDGLLVDGDRLGQFLLLNDHAAEIAYAAENTSCHFLLTSAF
jgi:hypothetical protein